MTEDAKKPLGRILLKQRAVTQPELERALANPGVAGTPLATRLTESGTVSEIAALKALSEQSGVPGIDLNQICLRLSDLGVLQREMATRHKILPVLVREDRIFLAMAAPTEKKVIDELEFVTGKRVFPYIALSGPLMRVIVSAYDLRDRGETHYVGPQCPAEIQRKAGLTPRTPEPAAVAPASVASVPATGNEARGAQQGTAAVAPAAAPEARTPTQPTAAVGRAAPTPLGAALPQRAAPPAAFAPPRAAPPPLPSRTRGTLPGPAAAAAIAALNAEQPAGAPPTVPSPTAPAPAPAAPAPAPAAPAPAPAAPAPAPPAHDSELENWPMSSRAVPTDPDIELHPTQVARHRSSPVIVDDAMGKMVAADELTDAGFGDANRDLSVVTSLPAEEKDGRRKILIVDDEPDIRKLLRRVFEDRKYRVLEADRGLAALRLVKEHVPDLMILDAMLPELHGFDIARRMKGSGKYGHIPIVMVSAVYRGWRIAEDLKSGYGVDAYIEKPFKVSDVVAAVETALASRTARSDSEGISADAEKRLAAGISAYRAGDIAKAVEELREGTRIDPLAYRLHFHLGLLYGKQGQVYDAIQELETALDINGKHFPALKNLAVLYQKAGFRNKAIETWERALGVAPDDPTRQSIKEHLLGLL